MFEIGQDGKHVLIMVSDADVGIARITEVECLNLIMALAQELRELHRVKRARGG